VQAGESGFQLRGPPKIRWGATTPTTSITLTTCRNRTQMIVACEDQEFASRISRGPTSVVIIALARGSAKSALWGAELR
jgi:hypothetical protein